VTALWIPAAHKGAQLQGSLAFLDAGPALARIEFYDGTPPSGGGAATNLLAVMPLADPAGSVIDNALVLAVPRSGLVLLDGVCTWARAFNGDGAIWADGLCTDEAGAGPFKLETTSLLAGGLVRLTSAVFT